MPESLLAPLLSCLAQPLTEALDFLGVVRGVVSCQRLAREESAGENDGNSSRLAPAAGACGDRVVARATGRHPVSFR
jgi:hypothetical protein